MHEGLSIAKRYRDAIKSMGLPIEEVILYGSVAKGRTHEWSDIDIAVICKPFGPTRHDENQILRKARRKVDLRIEPFSLHPEDFENRYWGLPKEVKRTGIAV